MNDRYQINIFMILGSYDTDPFKAKYVVIGRNMFYGRTKNSAAQSSRRWINTFARDYQNSPRLQILKKTIIHVDDFGANWWVQVGYSGAPKCSACNGMGVIQNESFRFVHCPECNGDNSSPICPRCGNEPTYTTCECCGRNEDENRICCSCEGTGLVLYCFNCDTVLGY